MQNQYNFYDSKIPLSDRVPTWESQTSILDKLVPSTIVDEI